MIRIKCPNTKCGKELGIDESKAGAVGACPNCGQKFRIPAASKTAAKTPAKDATPPKPAPKPGSANANKKHWQADDDFDPYAVKQEVEEKGPPEDDRVDTMVRDDTRNRKREKAWKEVGLATTLMKVLSLVIIGIMLLLFIGVSIDVILYNFKLEQMKSPPPGEPKVDPPTMFFADFFNSPRCCSGSSGSSFWSWSSRFAASSSPAASR
jgi:predicted  nucleic acid-binding Zn-ribbon protein